ncbi:DUF2073 domain-containing protein [Candidatus Micrarchaeota archaeon]|nr:DUF2073 domain-containing protein [Candidatus Micrarchaeota archaeon]
MGIELQFISAEALRDKTPPQKVEFILEEIKKSKDRILVIEGSLSNVEERELIAKTMQLVSKKFPGIEVASLGEQSSDFKAQLIKLLGGKPAGLTVVGPSTLVKQIKRDPNKLSLLTGK